MTVLAYFKIGRISIYKTNNYKFFCQILKVVSTDSTMSMFFGFSSNPENDTDLSDNYSAVDVPVKAKVNIRVTGYALWDRFSLTKQNRNPSFCIQFL